MRVSGQVHTTRDTTRPKETGYTLLVSRARGKFAREKFFSAGACVESEPGVSDRAYPSRDCLPGGESEGEEVGSGRARGEQTGKSTASASASAFHPLCRRTRFSKCLWRMSARQTIPWEKALWLGKRRISRARRSRVDPSIVALFLCLFRLKMRTVKFMPLSRLMLILFDKWRGSKILMLHSR